MAKSFDDFLKARGITEADRKKAYKLAAAELPLAALRQAAGVTQSEMAEKLGKSQASVSKFEGRGDFLCSTLYRYARAIGADIAVRLNVAGRQFDLLPKDDDGNIVFALGESQAKTQEYREMAAQIGAIKIGHLKQIHASAIGVISVGGRVQKERGMEPVWHKKRPAHKADFFSNILVRES